MKIIAFTAPSGAGKTTIAKAVLTNFPEMSFSVSATTRPIRGGEVDGIHYHFIDEAAFKQHISAGDFVEYEEVYPGRFYGTLKSEIETKATNGVVLLDIDVRGATNVKNLYHDHAFVVFIAPPSMKVLEQRLLNRNTESPETLKVRIEQAYHEMKYDGTFDATIVNDQLAIAISETLSLIKTFVAN